MEMKQASVSCFPINSNQNRWLPPVRSPHARKIILGKALYLEYGLIKGNFNLLCS